MRVVLSGGGIHRFGGFVNDEKEFEKLKEFFKVRLLRHFPLSSGQILNGTIFQGYHYNEYFHLQEFYSVEFKQRELSLTGRNWGTVNFDAASLEFAIDKHNAFEVWSFSLSFHRNSHGEC